MTWLMRFSRWSDGRYEARVERNGVVVSRTSDPDTASGILHGLRLALVMEAGEVADVVTVYHVYDRNEEA